jgi:hypothetical protein
MGKEADNQSFISELKEEFTNPEGRENLKDMGYALVVIGGGVTGIYGIASENWVVFGLGSGVSFTAFGILSVRDFIKRRRNEEI